MNEANDQMQDTSIYQVLGLGKISGLDEGNGYGLGIGGEMPEYEMPEYGDYPYAYSGGYLPTPLEKSAPAEPTLAKQNSQSGSPTKVSGDSSLNENLTLVLASLLGVALGLLFSICLSQVSCTKRSENENILLDSQA